MRPERVAALCELLEARQLFTALTWSPGGSGGAWDHVTPNWVDGLGAHVLFHDGDSVTFGDAGAGAVTIDPAGVIPAAVAVSSQYAYDLGGAGSIGGSGSLTKDGIGTLTLSGSGSNSFTGPTFLNGGLLLLAKNDEVNAVAGGGGAFSSVEVNGGSTLRWAANEQIPNGDGVRVFDGTMDLNGHTETLSALPVERPTSQVLTGTGTLNVTGLIGANQGTFTIDAGGIVNAGLMVVGNGGASTLNIAGTLSLGTGGESTFEGPSTLGSGGAVTVESGGVLKTATSLLTLNASSNTSVQPGGVLDVGAGGIQLFRATLTLQSDSATPGRMKLGGDVLASAVGGNFINNGGVGLLPGVIDIGASTRSFNVTGSSCIVTASIVGSGGVNKIGAGAMSFRGANTYTGLTQLNAGYVEAATPTAFGSAVAGTIVADGVQLDLDGQAIPEDVTFTASGVLRNESGNSVLGGSSNNQPATLTGLLTLGGAVTVQGNNPITLNTVTGPGSLTKATGNTVILGGSAANSFTGRTTVQGGILELNKPAGVNALVATGIPAGDVVISGGTLKWDASNEVIDNSGIEISGGTLNLNNHSETARTVLMEISNAGVLSVGGGVLALTDQANLTQGTVTVTAGGSLSALVVVLGDGIGSHTMTANFAGVVNVGASGGRFYNTATVTVQLGGVLTTAASTGKLVLLGSQNTVQANGKINIGSGGLEFGNASNLVTLNSDASNPGQLNLSGDITDTAAFGKTIASGGSAAQPGVVNLIGDRTFNVATGTLFVSARLNQLVGTTLTTSAAGGSAVEFDRAQNLVGSLAALGTVNLATGNLTVAQTLSGTGPITGSGLTFANGTVSPGTSRGSDVGTLATTSIFFAAGSKYTPQLETGNDLLDVTGTVTLTGSSLAASGSAPASSYTIIRNDGADPVVGTFSGLPEGASVSVNSKVYRISYVGGDGNDVVLNGSAPTQIVASSVATTYGAPVVLSGTVTDTLDNSVQISEGSVAFTVLDASNHVVASTTSPVSNGVATSVPLSGLAVQAYTIQAVYQGTQNFQATTTPPSATLTISKAQLTVTADNQSKVYGAADPALSYTLSGTLFYGDTPAVVSSVSLATVTGAAATAGSHVIVASGGTAANYNITDVNGTLVVAKAAALTVTADDKAKVYGAADPGLTYSTTGTFFYGDTAAVVDGVSLATATGAGATAGIHVINASGGTAANYNIVDVNGTLIVAKAAALTVTADDQTKVYGAADPNLTYSVTGTTYYGDSAQAVVSGVSLATTTGANATAGTHAITASGGVASNYNVVDVNGTLTVAKAAALTVTGDDQTKVYGAADSNLTYSLAGTLYYGDSPSVVTSVSLSTATGAAATAGGHAITALGGTAANYDVVDVDGTLTVGKAAALTVTADDQSKVYGGADPVLTYGVTGTLFYGDTSAVISGVTLSTATGANATAGVHAIVALVGVAANYDVVDVNGTLAVAKAAAVTVTADDQTKVYGNADPSLTYSVTGVTYYGDLAQALVTGVSLSTTTGANATAGSQLINATGGTAANYGVNDVSGTLTVNKAAALTVRADDQSKVYGAADPSLTFTVSGQLFYGDTAAVVSGVLLSTTTGASATAGMHPINTSGGVSANYNLVDAGGTLTVAKAAALTVTADDKFKVYGAADPGLTYTVTGTTYYGDIRQSVVTGVALSATTGASATAGTHAIMASGGTAANYNVNDVAGTLTVSKATALVVTADDQAKIYGAADPVLTYTTTGILYYDDTAAVVSGVLLSTTTGAAATAGTHAITAVGGTAANYDVVDANGTLTVAKAAALTVTADDKAKVYGASDPSLTYTITGATYYGDSAQAVVSGVLLATTTGANATAGTHAITASGGVASNYNVVDLNGTLTVAKAAALTVTADNQTKVYGAADPGLTYTTSGTLYYGDTPAVISGVSLSISTGTALPAGTYPITASGGVAANYNVSDNNGVLTVSADATITTVASSTTSNTGYYGQTVTFTATVTAVAPGMLTPVGLVQFYDNGVALGAPQALDAGGHAAVTTSTLSIGTNLITAQYLGSANFLPSSTSLPLVQDAAAGIIVLDKSASGALTVSGNGDIVVQDGSIIVDSNKSNAVIVSGNGTITATEISIDGGDKTTGNATINGIVVTGQNVVADPLAGLAAPDPSTLTVQSTASLSFSDNITVTLNPGVYKGGIQISGNANVTLNPGIYYMLGGGFSVSGNGTVTDLGRGVLLYNAPTSSGGSIAFSGNGKVSLTAMTTGIWQGLVMFQARTSAVALNITGNGTLSIFGTIYAAGATLNITGNAGVDANGVPLDTIGSMLIVDDLKVSGNGTFAVRI